MSVPEQTPYKEYTGNGVTKNFALEFTCDSKQELKVFIDNVEPELSTWSLVGGSVVFTTAPASGSIIVLKRATKLERATNYSSTNNSFRPEVINKDLDRIWYALQDQAYKLGQYDFDYTYAINTSNQAKQIAQNAHQRADSAYELADQTQPINKGGTGATTAENARTNLEVYSQAEVDALIATGGDGNVVGISGGGTGATTAPEARINLGVPSAVEVADAIEAATPQATSTAKGQAKIATTAIAQAGVNDTDFITAKKLRDALNASGNAPVLPLRAKGWITQVGVNITGFGGFNISSITRVSQGTYRVTFTHQLPDDKYVFFGTSLETASNEFARSLMLDYGAPITTSEFTFTRKGDATTPFDSTYIVFGVA